MPTETVRKPHGIEVIINTWTTQPDGTLLEDSQVAAREGAMDPEEYMEKDAMIKKAVIGAMLGVMEAQIDRSKNKR